MGRKIHILCHDGSPLGVTEDSIYGRDGRMGVGGAELALLTMCRAWEMYGNDVTLYNNPNNPLASKFKQKAIAEFDPQEDRDILIIFRSPFPEKTAYAKGKKIWWSCDQQTVGDFRGLAGEVSQIVTISKRHATYFKEMYGISNTTVIDLPVRTWEYKKFADVKKNPYECIFTSMPDRGVMPLQAVWDRVVKEIPQATLTITSDWRLWAEWQTEQAVQPYRLSWASLPNVNYRAAVKRDELIQIQENASLHIYPCIYDELFCIAVAESQVAGAFPITSDYGSLGTTNMGMVLHGNPQDAGWVDVCVQKAVELLTDSKLRQKQEWVTEVARKRFSIENILGQWESKVFA